MDTDKPIIVAFGGGTNSTAMLIGMWERGIRPDLILFADTGGEVPETYAHTRALSEWLVDKLYPEIVWVQSTYKGLPETLEDNCLRMNMLPSIAYGYKACSMKHKQEPQNKYVNNWQPAREWWESGGKCAKLIGYDAGEERRSKIKSDDKYTYEFPLIEWGWHREECVTKCEQHGFRPAKSACFFCPNAKKHEVIKLSKTHPDLMKRALAMEAGAELTSIKGLGRRWAWRDLLDADHQQLKLIPDDYKEMPCGCYDGE